ncbi:hypothetical protein GCM10010400_23730 [Streptomyces aculeolatus]
MAPTNPSAETGVVVPRAPVAAHRAARSTTLLAVEITSQREPAACSKAVFDDITIAEVRPSAPVAELQRAWKHAPRLSHRQLRAEADEFYGDEDGVGEGADDPWQST